MDLDTKLSQLKGGKMSVFPAALLQAVISVPFLLLTVAHAFVKPVNYISRETKPKQGRLLTRSGTKLKVMTFNIRCGVDRSSSYDLSRCVASILKEDPDVVLLQEVTGKAG